MRPGLVGQVRDGRELVESARQLIPDIVVTDIAMPQMSGLEAMRQLKAEGSTARFIVLTVDLDPRVASEAVRAGASGYVLKQAAGEELLDAIHAVMAGLLPICLRPTSCLLRGRLRIDTRQSGGTSLHVEVPHRLTRLT